MIRLIFGLILGVVVVIFAIQNTESVTYTFLAWSVTAPRAFIVIVVFVFGLLAGWLVPGIGRIGRRRPR